MSGLESANTVPRSQAGRTRLVALAALGAWTIAIPYLGPPLGLELDVASSTEVVDHVVPGVAILLAVAAAWSLQRSPNARRGDAAPVAAVAIVFLSGFWITVTHVPLLAEAANDESPWDAAIWHNMTGIPVVLISLWMLVGPLFGPEEPS
jgi:hypothetical protein